MIEQRYEREITVFCLQLCELWVGLFENTLLRLELSYLKSGNHLNNNFNRAVTFGSVRLFLAKIKVFYTYNND